MRLGTKIAVTILLYLNIAIATNVLSGRLCPPAPTTDSLVLRWEHRDCHIGVFFKSVFWPAYWVYRFWDAVL